jgi:hypothetical protein
MQNMFDVLRQASNCVAKFRAGQHLAGEQSFGHGLFALSIILHWLMLGRPHGKISYRFTGRIKYE